MSDKKIEDYLHLYLGCKVVVEDRVVAKFLQYDFNEKVCSVDFDNGRDYSYYTTNHIKPILRPLSSITHDEDAAAWNIWNEDFVRAMGINCGTAYEAGKIKYLLSRDFDLFGLIEAGLALDQSKVKL